MKLVEELRSKKNRLAVIGLGYVGLPLAVEFAKKFDVIGFDINKSKIDRYKKYEDPTNEVGSEALKTTTVLFSSDETVLQTAKFFIVAVPTPINNDKTPDLRIIIGASEITGRNLTKGSIVVFESTVYPGVTEEVCVPILEKQSGLKCGIDFKIGYSPERINPGDKIHTLTKITKIVSGMDEEALDDIAGVYGAVIDANVYRAESIKIAEAVKVMENSQRDINIAFMNELSIIFNKLNIDTNAVLRAASTKWNFLNFRPGLVGGHCIGVDPYYLTYKAEQIGYHPQVILSGRRINDSMGKYIAENTVKCMIKSDIQIKGSKVLVLGLSFKENVPDIRNTRVVDIISELQEYGVKASICDPLADKEEAMHEYGLELCDMDDVEGIDAVIMAVAHKDFMGTQLLEELWEKYKSETRVFIDVKGVYGQDCLEKYGYAGWGL